jgi:two-component system, NarL family, nitrate/nitrite response regulator NarL
VELRTVSKVAAVYESPWAGFAWPEVIVVAPVRVHRESLAAAFRAARSVSVIGECATIREALVELRAHGPRALGVLDGPLLSRLVVELSSADAPNVKLLAIGVPHAEAVAWIEAGVSGCVAPDASFDDLIDAVQRVAANEVVASPEVTAHLANRLRCLSAAVPRGGDDGRLTFREGQVLDLLAEGLSNKEIAQRLSIQVQTVKNHVHNVLLKLGVSRRAEVAARARRL